MRIMIAGAGIAGLTLATLLTRQGHDVIVVERRPGESAPGYGLALWPHGTRVLHAVGGYDEFVSHSQRVGRYTASDRRGRVLSSSPMPAQIEEYGHLGMLARGDLIGMLERAAHGVDLRYETTIATVTQDADGVDVALSDDRIERVDALIGADGIGSHVREHAIAPGRRYDTGWACLVWWAEPSLTNPDGIVERWGAGSFLGTYPCPGRVCVIAGMPAARLRNTSHVEAARRVLSDYGLTAPGWSSWMADDLSLWPMSDVRARRWTSGRVALVGDAAAAFLPTAGVGASMALESAAALADELSRADAHSATKALELYERRRRRRTERAQTLSRRLARLMFVSLPPVAAARNLLLARSSVDSLVGPLIRDLRRPI